jgi:pSer/pThr/pTyr-binding forkhead associated (FHA) protein
MSGVHFSVEGGPAGFHVVDKKSANGTYLNGKRVEQALLNTGDEIKSGGTLFVATIVEDGSRSSQAAPNPSTPAPLHPSGFDTLRTPRCVIGGWSFSHVPPDWEVKEGVGMVQKIPGGGFQSNITAMEERLGSGITIENYVEAQIKMLREYLKEPEIEAAIPPTVVGAEKSVGVQIRYSTKEKQTVFINRIYIQNGPIVGVVSLTTIDSELRDAQQTFEKILSKAAFLPKS